MTSGRLLARNTVINLLSQGIPVVVAIVAVPVLIAGIGKDRFGVLTIGWAAIGYFSLFDVGLGRALTQAVSASLGANDESRLNAISATALTIMALLGAVGGVIVAALTPWLVNHALQIPPELHAESRLSFYLLAASLPFVVMTAGFRGLLEAHQHFGTATMLRLPYATFAFLGPMLILPWSRSLTAVVGMLTAGRVALWAAHLIVCLRRYPFLRRPAGADPAGVVSLLRIGAWMTLSNIVSPLMVNLDRFLIGAFLSMTAVTLYATPFEIVIKLLLLPGALLGVLFPAFASTYGTAPERTGDIFDGAMRLMVFAMFPATLAFVAFPREILGAWVGPDFVGVSATIMQVLALGVFVNSLGQVPFAALQAIGRPDLTAKLHAVELPLYLAATVVLMDSLGLIGVAIAWTLRIVLDTVVLCWMTRDLIPDARRAVLRIGATLAILVAAVCGVAAPPSVVTRIILSALLAAAIAPIAWRSGLRPRERDLILRFIRQPRRAVAS
jgi:O-antigen/teichoic acid export membrane protein